MSETSSDYRVVESCYGDPLRRGGGSPYQRYPERSSWTEFEVREYPDGTRRRFERDGHRWAGQTAWGRWTEVPTDEPAPPCEKCQSKEHGADECPYDDAEGQEVRS